MIATEVGDYHYWYLSFNKCLVWDTSEFICFDEDGFLNGWLDSLSFDTFYIDVWN